MLEMAQCMLICSMGTIKKRRWSRRLMKRRRKQSKQHVYPCLKHAIIRASTREKQHQLFVETDRYSPLCGDAISVGTTYNQYTQHWLIWLSTNGLDITILCAHDDQPKANAVVHAITGAAQSGDFADAMKLPVLLRQWRASGIPEPCVPEEILATIGRDILHHVIPLHAPTLSKG